MADHQNKLSKFWDELNRRKVVRVIIVYATTAFILLQLVSILIEPLHLPHWVMTFFILLLVIGFPIAIIFSWIFDTTKQGITITRSIKQENNEGTSVKDIKKYFIHLCRVRKVFQVFLVVIIVGGLVYLSWYYFDNRNTKKQNFAELVQQINTLYSEMVNDQESFKINNWKAYGLLLNAERIMPKDTAISQKKVDQTKRITILTEPSGANIYGKSYLYTDTSWIFLGTTPLINARFPRGPCCTKIVKEGFQKHFDAFVIKNGRGAFDTLSYKLMADVNADKKVALIAGQFVQPEMNGVQNLKPQWVGDFLIDKYEVTNEEFKKFVDDGGYRNPKYWLHKFVIDDCSLTWENGIELFKDETGIPQPLKWIAGSYPEGEEKLPVSGISWYEAAAYAVYLGKSLPSVYHWNLFFDRELLPYQVEYSNIDNKFIAQVGTFNGMSKHGVYDLIGNVREWIYNSVNEEKYVVGGSAIDPRWGSVQAYSDIPWKRDEYTGFRCIEYLNDSNKINLESAQNNEIIDSSQDKPVSDEVFKHFVNDFKFVKKPVNVKNILVEDFKEWKHEIVTVDPVYEGPEMEIHIYKPNNVAAPYQTVILFPGIDAENSPYEKINNYPTRHEFLLRSGRAIILPQYFNTYERGKKPLTDEEKIKAFRNRVKDIQYTIDYLETRKDIDTSKIAYCGISWGSTHSPYILSIEKRFKIVSLKAFGLSFSSEYPEWYHLNYLPRIKIPLLMLSGKYDYAWSHEKQFLFYKWLGTREADKKWILEEDIHGVSNAVYQREAIMWFDKYFGKAVNM